MDAWLEKLKEHYECDFAWELVRKYADKLEAIKKYINTHHISLDNEHRIKLSKILENK